MIDYLASRRLNPPVFAHFASNFVENGNLNSCLVDFSMSNFGDGRKLFLNEWESRMNAAQVALAWIVENNWNATIPQAEW
jgi:hypothetical protein